MRSVGGSGVLFSLLLILQIVYGQIGSSCRTPNGESAKCKQIYDCKVLLNSIQTQSSEQRKFIRESQCGYDSNVPLVCCGTKNNYAGSTTSSSALSSNGRPKTLSDRGSQEERNTGIPDRSTCGIQIPDKIFGGNQTSIDEFPWVALLEYKDDSNNQKFSCGGAVISKRYVLTAAHCITGEIRKKVGRLVNVRLGEWDLRQDVDCTNTGGVRVCNNPAENFGIDETLVHPEYDTTSSNRYYDIALIRVDRDIKFSNFIQPICLPLPSESSTLGEKLVVAGWGKTENVNQNAIKLKVEVPIAERSKCTSKFRSAGIQLRDSQICAGGVRGKDSCTGDSGGPLMRTAKDDSSQWYVEGIVSFGAACGTEGWPGIYTKVSDYLKWIKENIRD